MAETVVSPVRGARRALVVGLLLLSGTAAGALGGFAAGLGWALARLPAIGLPAAASVGVAAVLADAAWARLGAPRPPSVNRQVPQVWGRLLSPPTVALLFGARLGVGPLTILPTWLWWAGLAVGAAGGPGWGAAAGASFAAARAGLTGAAGAWLGRRGRPAAGAEARRRRSERPIVGWPGAPGASRRLVRSGTSQRPGRLRTMAWRPSHHHPTRGAKTHEHEDRPTARHRHHPLRGRLR